MSLIITAASYGLSQLPKARLISRWKWGAAAIGSLAPIVSGSAGFFGTYHSMGHTYGTGTSAMYGAASMFPITGIPLMIHSGIKSLGDFAWEQQQTKRRSSFVKNQMNDKFGTINMMRQYAGQQMRRDHASAQRVLGNEASYIHGRG